MIILCYVPMYIGENNHRSQCQFNYAVDLIVDSTASYGSQYFSICELLGSMGDNKVMIN